MVDVSKNVKRKTATARAKPRVKLCFVQRHVMAADSDNNEGTDTFEVPAGLVEAVTFARVAGEGYAESSLEPGDLIEDGVCEVNYQIDTDARKFTYRLTLYIRLPVEDAEGGEGGE